MNFKDNMTLGRGVEVVEINLNVVEAYLCSVAACQNFASLHLMLKRVVKICPWNLL